MAVGSGLNLRQALVQRSILSWEKEAGMKSNARNPILIVEDNDDDFEMIIWALKKLSIAMQVCRCIDWDEALDYLHGRGAYTDPQQAPRPAIILLDLNLMAMDGQEVLAHIKNDDTLK